MRCCARPALAAADAECLAGLLAGPLDWACVLRLARRHRLVPLVARHLLAPAHSGAVPATAAHSLGGEARDQAMRALALAGELLALVDAAAAAGVRLLAYKGPALAQQAYGDVTLRRCSDLDLVTPAADVDGALALLAARGYAPGYAFTPRQDSLFRRVDGDFPLTHPRTGTLVELHCRVSSERFGVSLPTDALWARRAHVTIAGRAVPTLGLEDLLLALALHGAKHRWARLEWVASLAALLRGLPEGVGDGILAALVARADSLGARRAVLLALALAADLLGAPVGEAVRQAATADRGLAPLAAAVTARMLAGAEDDEDDEDDADTDDTAARLLFNLRAKERLSDRLRYAARWAFVPTPEDWSWARLPDEIFGVYRVLRPIRLTIRVMGR